MHIQAIGHEKCPLSLCTSTFIIMYHYLTVFFFILNSYPLYYELTGKDLAHSTENRESKGFLIHLSYSPEHINLFSEVVTAMQVADGALFLVDCIKGRFSEANN